MAKEARLKQGEYTAESIQHLSGLEGIRKRPAMYLSSAGKAGVYRGFKEVVDNCLDEYLAGRNSLVYIIVETKLHRVTVIDHGHGIPTEVNSKTKESALTTVFTKLHAGGKFDQGAYQVSSGLHGIGAKATNATSKVFEVWTNTGKGWFSQKFSKGKPTSKVVKENPPKNLSSAIGKKGTVVRWIPDETVFKETTATDTNRMKKELRDIQFLCPGIKIHLDIDGTKSTYHSEKGLKDLVYRDSIRGKAFTYESKNLEVAINWTGEEGCEIKSFVNISHTSNGGTHLNGLRQALSKALREYTEEKVELDDLFEGMIGAIHFKMSDPAYHGQTKEELTSPEGREEVYNQLLPKLKKFFADNKSLTQSIVAYAEKILKERGKLKDAKDVLRGVDRLTKGTLALSDKLMEPDRKKYKNKMDCELYIVEGDSAGGHIKQAREGYQGVLKLRGKFLNPSRTKASQLIGNGKDGGNQEVKNIISSYGSGVLDKCKPENARYGKVIIMADGDVDGKHITNLAVSLFVHYMPEVIKQGRLFTIDAPLFTGVTATKRVYGKTRQEVIKKLKGAKADIIRMKGWGEANAEQMADIAMNPETRKLIQIKWTDDLENEMYKVMGEDVSFRKELLGVA